jgi:CDP-paratose 2-epimerase
VYWYSVEDLAPERETLDGFHCDERAYHFGLQRRGGKPKLVARVLADRGLDGVREMVRFASAGGGPAAERGGALVTGGAGYVGTVLADRLASSGTRVTVLDSLVRPGAEESVRRLKEKHGGLVRIDVGDVRDVFAVRRALAGVERVFHLAAQTDPAAALADPRSDLDVNVQGTFNVLEEMRRLEAPPALVFASDVDADAATPQSSSKSAAERYVLAYANSFGLRTCVVRMGEIEDAQLGDAADELLAASPKSPAPSVLSRAGA